tara:strand:- start:157 stop:867 length:711 start_codon:yes stop_codon:yes gene_type:complete
MKIIFIGRSKFGQYCLNNFKKHSVQIINPNNFKISDFENVDIVFYSRNIAKIDFYFFKKIKNINTNLRFVFLDTELNKKVITINTSLLIKKIEFYYLSRFFKNIERYYIPIVLGNNMNWTNSLTFMRSSKIPLVCYKKGFVNIVSIEDLIAGIIQKKQIFVKSITVDNFAKTNNVELKIINEGVFKKLMFHIKYNLITSVLLLIKNQIKPRNPSLLYNKKASVITLVDFYKLIISE